MADQVVNIFLSSPSDVQAEREAAERVVNSLNAEIGMELTLNLIRWEKNFYTASSGFQDQISGTEDSDLVICIFWKSLGSELPEHYRRTDGVLPTGTEFEFEAALNRSLKGPDQVPDILVYRKTADVLFHADTAELEQQQFARFKAFWGRWFRNEQGHYVAGFHTFEDLSDFESQLRMHVRQWIERRTGEITWQDGCPFRGLESFDLEHAPIFFGRDRDVSRLRARFLANALRGVGMLVVAGPSGSGKSSLIKAGLLPNILQTTSLPDLPRFAVQRAFRPSDLAHDWPSTLAWLLFEHAALSDAFSQGDATTPDKLARAMRAAPSAGAMFIEGALNRLAPDDTKKSALILLLDQMEELFAWPTQDQHSFTEFLEECTKTGTVFVVASMRSEFVSRIPDLPALRELTEIDEVTGASAPIITISAPASADLRDIIQKPAQAAGLRYEAGDGARSSLDLRIEQDTPPEALPALQFLLAKLYAMRDGPILTHNSYEKLGGVSQVMARAGDTALQALTDEEQSAFASLARRLVVIRSVEGAAISRPVEESELAKDELRVASVLVKAGLFVRGVRAFRIAHEALLSDWARLAALVSRDRRLFEARYRLGLQARSHADLARSAPARAKSALLTGHALSEGQELQSNWSAQDIGTEVPELPGFIDASIAASRRARLRVRAAVLGIAAVIFGAMVVTMIQIQRAGEFELRAQLQASTAKAAQASLRTGDWPVAVAEARRARSLAQNADTLSLAVSVSLGADSEELVEIRAGDHVEVGFTQQGTLYALEADGKLSIGRSRIAFPAPTRPQERYLDGFAQDSGAAVALTNLGKGFLSRDGEGFEPFTWWSGDMPPPRSQLLKTSNGFVVLIAGRGSFTTPGLPRTPWSILRCTTSVQPISCEDEPFEIDVDRGTQLRSLVVSPDHHFVAYSTSPRGFTHTLYLTELNTNALPKHLGEFEGIRQMVFAESGKTLLIRAKNPEFAGTISQPRRKIFAVNLEGEPKTRTFLELSDSAFSFGANFASSEVFYDCGSQILCVDDDGHTKRKLTRLVASPYSMAMSKDGLQIATIALGELRHWSFADEASSVSILPEASSTGFRALWVSPDKTIFAMERDMFVHRWSPDGTYSKRLGNQILTNNSSLHNIAGLADGTLAMVYGIASVGEYDPSSDTTQFTKTPFAVSRIALNPAGGWVAAGLQGLVRSQGLVPAPDGLRVGGLTSHGEDIFFSTIDGGLWKVVGAGSERAVPYSQSEDTQAGLSLDVHPDGRFISVTRSDRKVLIHDLKNELAPAQLDLPTADSRTVAFSPDGTRIAVLTSAGDLGIWNFDAATNTVAPHVFTDPIPPALVRNVDGPALRQGNWIAWADNDRISIASETGDIIILSIDPDVIDARLNALHVIYE